MPRIFFGILTPLLIISNLHAADCESDLLTKGQLYVQLIRMTARKDAFKVAEIVSRTLAQRPLANPFPEGTPEFKYFEIFFQDLPQASEEEVKALRLRIIGTLNMEESSHLADLTNQEIPKARSP